MSIDYWQNPELFSLFQDLFSSIASYKITGENVLAKQEIIRSKMKLVDQTAFAVRIKTLNLFEIFCHVLA